MQTFIQYLEEIESLKKAKKFDEAWGAANKGITDLLKQKDDMWFMMYYQMADILAREKKWAQALSQMGLVIHFLHGLGGITHEKFVKRLLKKFNKEMLFDKYIELSLNTEPGELDIKVQELLNTQEIDYL